MKKLFPALLMGCMLTCSCSGGSTNEEPTPEPTTPTEEKLPIKISAGIKSRATETQFEQNDKVGIYVVNYNGNTPGQLQASGNQLDNMCFTYSSGWESTYDVYWKDSSTRADFYAYYPYDKNITSPTGYKFTVKEDQSSESNYKASIFLWGKAGSVAPTSNPVDITVTHAMSNLLIYLVAGNGYIASDLAKAKVTICALKTEAEIDLSTGAITASGSNKNINPYKASDCYKVLIAPQSVNNSELIRVTIDDMDYTLTQSITFESNKQYTCTLTINRNSEGVNITIGGWEKDTIDYGGVLD